MTINLVAHLYNNPRSLTPDWLRGKTLAGEQFPKKKKKKITVIISISEVTYNSSDLIVSFYFSKSHSFKERVHCILTWENISRLGLIFSLMWG